MVYREAADKIAAREAQREATGPLLVLDVSGRPGQDGANGLDGRDGFSSGSDGEDGLHAGTPDRGEHAGAIAITLRSDARDGVATVAGRTESYRHGAHEVLGEVEFRRAGNVELIARGGAGGAGGRGGSGGNGARGRDGSDATRYSSGGNGGRGGDGGNGGEGTSGASGGNGGNIVVRVAERDAHLLMLVKGDIGGGRGGAPGQNGAGGLGGRGGRGGSSYSWTETESYRDSNGNTQTRSTSHRNSGGSDGRPGRPGRDANAVLHPGKRGKEGNFTIEVLDERGTIARYERCYDVQLLGFRHRNENDDGIYEPEEKVFVGAVEIENTGGMPLPAHQDIIVRLVDDGWIAPAPEQKLVLPHALPAGGRHVFENEELALQLRVFRPQRSDVPLAAPETIRLVAELPSVHRSFGGFFGPGAADHGRIVIRFPIEVSRLETLYSLAPGQAARIRWAIRNVSGKTFGSAGEVRRAVAVKLVLGGGELGANGIHFFDRDTLVPLTDGYECEVPEIGPNEVMTFEGTIAIPENAPPYTSARLVVSAQLGHIADPERVRAIQYQEITIRVGRPFDARGSDVLLVVNNRSTAEEVAAWERLVAALGLSVSTWDASLEAGVDVLRRTALGEQAYRLVIVLNNTMDTGAGEKRPSALVDKETSLALADRGIHVIYAGKGPAFDTLLVPTNPAGEADDVLDAIVENARGDRIGGTSHTIVVRAWYIWPWSTPRAEHLERRARALAERLERAYPERRYVVVHRFDFVQEEKKGFSRLYKLGTIEVRRTLDRTRGAITNLEVDPNELHAPSFVDDDATFAVVAAALPFADKLRLLDGEMPFGARRPPLLGGCPDVIVAAVLDSLVREQVNLAREGWRKGAGYDELLRAMPMLEDLAKHAFAAGPLDGDRAKRFVELIAWLDFIARDHDRFWEWLPPLVFLRRGPTLRRAVRARLEELVLRVADPKSTWMAIAERRAEIALTYRDKKKAREVERAHELAAERLHAHIASRRLELDESIPSKLLDAAEHDAIAQKDAGRAARAKKIVDGANAAKENLLLRTTCAELLAKTRSEAAPREATPPPATRVADDAGALDALAELREDGASAFGSLSKARDNA